MANQSSLDKDLKSADDQGKLILYLTSLDGITLNRECSSTLGWLHNNGNISLASEQNIEAINSLDKDNFWRIFHAITDALPDLNCSHREILRLVHTIAEKAGNDGAAGIPNTQLVKWCEQNPEKARTIINEAKNLDSLSLSHCVYSLQGLKDLELAFELCENKDRWFSR